MKLDIVIPAHNESGNIRETILEILSILDKVPAVESTGVLVVDDKSEDKTFEAVESFNDPNIRAIRLSRQSGSHVALRAGLKQTDGDAVLCISADGQDNPARLGEMLGKWQNGAHIVWALRENRHNEPLPLRLMSSAFYTVLFYLGGVAKGGIDLSRADFYLLDRSVVAAINSCPETNTSLFGLVAWLGFVQDSVEYTRRERRSGASKWNFKSRFKLASDWIVAFSGLPLKIISLAGVATALLGFLYALYLVINAFFNVPPEGWSTITVGILILGGIQMIMLGVLGEYLWRNLEESRQRPLYFIEKKSRGLDGEDTKAAQ